MERFTTISDVVDQYIRPALDVHAAGVDMEAVARETFAFKIDVDSEGRELDNTAGFELAASDEEFWGSVARHTSGDLPPTDSRPDPEHWGAEVDGKIVR